MSLADCSEVQRDAAPLQQPHALARRLPCCNAAAVRAATRASRRSDLFLSQSSGGRVVHRLAMFDAHAEITAIISQLDVLRCGWFGALPQLHATKHALICSHAHVATRWHTHACAARSAARACRFLLQHSDQLGPSASSSIDELGLVSASKQLLTLEPSLPTLLAFERLAAAGVTGAPVLSSQGELIANLSTSDVR